MCMLCVEYNRGRLTVREALGAAREMILTAKPDQSLEHLEEVKSRLQEDLVTGEINKAFADARVPDITKDASEVVFKSWRQS